ncbi:MAG: stalk domain-containing protein [bacterium]
MSLFNKARLSIVVMVMVVGFAYATTYPPQVSFVTPSNGATISGEVKVTVAFSATGEHPITKLEFYVDRQLVEETVFDSPLLRGQQVYYLNTLKMVNGPHSLLARAYSRPEDVGESTITVYVNNGLEDVTPPLVEILSPKEGQKLWGKVEVKIKAEDDRGVKYVMLFIDDKFKFLKNYPPYTDIWDTTNYLNGLHILQAFAYDAADNKGESKPVKVTVDNPSGKTSLGEEKIIGKEEITPPSIVTPPSVPEKKEAKGEAVSSPTSGKVEPVEVKKEEGTTFPPIVSKKETIPTAIGKGKAVSSPSGGPQEVSKEEGKLTITLSLPRKETVPSTAGKGQAVPSGAVSPKEVVKESRTREKKVGGVPVLPPVLPKVEAKGSPTPPALESVEARSLPSTKGGEKSLVVAPSSSKPTSAKAGAMLPSESPLSHESKGKRPMLVVSRPRENISVVSSNVSQGNSFKVHNIQKGECLIKIARAYGIPWEILASVNNIANPDLIREGEKLLVPNITVQLNDNEVNFPDAHPFVKNNLPLVPFRAVFETAGGQVIWHAESREVEAHKGDKNILLKIGSRKAQVNDQTILMEVAAFIKYSRTYVPATFFHYALDAQIKWDPQTGHLYISAP